MGSMMMCNFEIIPFRVLQAISAFHDQATGPVFSEWLNFILFQNLEGFVRGSVPLKFRPFK